MRIFIDACVDPRITAAFPDHDVQTAAQLGYQRAKDKELILLLQGHFDVLITIDRGFEFQHNIKTLPFGIVIVHVLKNKIEFYRSLFAQLQKVAAQIQPGEVVHIR